jgi:hypothetical protein
MHPSRLPLPWHEEDGIEPLRTPRDGGSAVPHEHGVDPKVLQCLANVEEVAGARLQARCAVRVVGTLEGVQQVCIRYSRAIAAFVAQRAAAMLEPGSASA